MLARRLRGAGGVGLELANTLKVFMGGLMGGYEEVAGSLVELGVVLVFHLDNPRLPPIYTAHGAHPHTP